MLQVSSYSGERSLRALLPLVAADAPVRWIDVAYTGTWLGHPAGPFTLSADVFRQVIANFESQVNPVPLDYEHQTQNPAAPKAPAAGWVHALKVVRAADGLEHLQALVEFGPEATRDIRTGAYRYCSAVFRFDARDRKSGEPVGCVMPSIGLTNTPYIDGQQPILLSQEKTPVADTTLDGTAAVPAANAVQADAGAQAPADEHHVADIKQALKAIQDEKTTIERLITVLQGLIAAKPKAGAEGSPEEEASESPEEAAAEGDSKLKDVSLDMASNSGMPGPQYKADDAGPQAEPVDKDVVSVGEQLMEKLKAAMPDMDDSAILGAVDAQMDAVVQLLHGAQSQDGPGVASTLSQAKDVTIRSLSERLARFEAQEKAAQDKARAKAEADAKARVGKLVTDGRLLSDAQQPLIDLALRDPAAYEKLELSLTSAPPMGRHASASGSLDGSEAGEPVELDETDPVVKQYMLSLDGLKRNGKELTKDEKVVLAKERISEIRRQSGARA